MWKVTRAFLATTLLGLAVSSAQTPAPSAPPHVPSSPSAAPSAQAPLQLQTLDPTTRADPFPAVDPTNFTAQTPTVEVVDSYLHTVMGFDANRIWRVLAVQKTIAPGVSRVVAAISERTAGAKVFSAVFFVLPDGKHLIAADQQGANVSPFGAHPYQDTRELLQAQADGPARGAPSKDLMLVEFADLQCTHCKEAEPTMNRLVVDFPKARIVFENFPLEKPHPYAFEAASYGVCVAKQGSDAFFAFAKAVYATQAALVPATADDTLNNAAKQAGADPAVIAACAKTPATKARVEAQMKLGREVGVDQTPTLVVNGRLIPLTVPYETMKNLIAFQASLDGVSAAAESPSATEVPVGPR